MEDQTFMNSNTIQKWCQHSWKPYYSTKIWKDAKNCHSANHSVFSSSFPESE